MKQIVFILFLFLSCNYSLAKEDEYEGVYYYEKIRKRGGFNCYSFNKNQTILHVTISSGSFDEIWEEKYTIAGDTIITENGWILVPSKYKKADKKMIDKIETRFGKILNGYGYCINKNFILRCKDILR